MARKIRQEAFAVGVVGRKTQHATESRFHHLRCDSDDDGDCLCALDTEALAMTPDFQLTDHFSFYELTHTDRTQFQEKNRIVTPAQIDKLKQVAHILECIRPIIEVPIKPTSGYRCPELNAAVGSSDRSQHLLCEASDFVPIGMDLGDAFRVIWKAVKERRLPVGQLIYETDATRFNGTVSWIHVSLGSPYRDQARCNQVLRMQDKKYTVLV